MQVKEYLLQAKYLDERITAKTQQLLALNDLATKCTSTISDMPRQSSIRGSRTEETITKILDLEKDLQQDIENLVSLKLEITKVIHSVDNIEYQVLLEKRYLCFETWEKIAVDMSYSMQHLHRIHSRALKEICMPKERGKKP